jgi:hypothetical protein
MAGAFVDSQHAGQVALRHARKSPRRAQLPPRDKVLAPIDHRFTNWFSRLAQPS